MGDDREGIIGIYEHFLKESSENIQTLKLLADRQDYKGIKAIAHKMTTMFAQINAKRESEILIILNKVLEEVPTELHGQIHTLEQLFENECRPAIEQYLKKLIEL